MELLPAACTPPQPNCQFGPEPRLGGEEVKMETHPLPLPLRPLTACSLTSHPEQCKAWRQWQGVSNQKAPSCRWFPNLCPISRCSQTVDSVFRAKPIYRHHALTSHLLTLPSSSLSSTPPIATPLWQSTHVPAHSPSSPYGTLSKLSLQRISGVKISYEEMAALSWQRGLGGGKKAAPSWLHQASSVESTYSKEEYGI